MKLESKRLIITTFDLSMAEDVHLNSLDEDNRKLAENLMDLYSRYLKIIQEQRDIEALPTISIYHTPSLFKASDAALCSASFLLLPLPTPITLLLWRTSATNTLL